MKRTIKEIAELLGVEEDAARGLVKFLLAVDLAKERGERQTHAGQRGPKVYEVSHDADAMLNVLLRKLRGDR